MNSQSLCENHDQPLPLVTAQYRGSRKITVLTEPRPEGAVNADDFHTDCSGSGCHLDLHARGLADFHAALASGQHLAWVQRTLWIEQLLKPGDQIERFAGELLAD